MKKVHGFTDMADALAVSKSGFFAHQRKGERPRAQQDKQLSDAIEPIFVASRRTYGSPRIMHALRRSGCRCGKNRIARLMRSRGLRARQKRRFRPKTTQSDHKLPVAPNWLAQIPKPDRPGQVWLADITYIQTKEGWLYFSGILDHCSRRCLAWHADDSLESSLVATTWEKACNNQQLQPRAPPPFRSRRPICQHPVSEPAALLRRSRFHESQRQSLRQRHHGKLLCYSKNRMLPKPNPKKSP
jgi:transposase InsO family protein